MIKGGMSLMIYIVTNVLIFYRCVIYGGPKGKWAKKKISCLLEIISCARKTFLVRTWNVSRAHEKVFRAQFTGHNVVNLGVKLVSYLLVCKCQYRS